MQDSKQNHLDNESPIFEHLTLLKVLKAKNGFNYVFHHGGAVSVVFKFEGINNTSMNEDDYRRVFSNIERVLWASLPAEEASVQFVARKVKREIKDDNSADVDNLLVKNRLKNYQRLVDSNVVFDYELYASVLIHGESVSTFGKIVDVAKSLFSKSKDKAAGKNIAFSNVREKLSKLEEIVKSIETSFDSLGIVMKRIDSQEDLYGLWQEFVRPNRSKFSKVKVSSKNESPRRELFSGVRSKMYRDMFMLDDTITKVYSLDRAPTGMISGGDIYNIFKNPLEMFYSVTFMKLSKETSKARFENSLWKRKMELSKSEGKAFGDKFAEADLARVDAEYARFASGESFGMVASVNVAINVQKSLLEKQAKLKNTIELDVLRMFESELFLKGFNGFGGSEWTTEEDGKWPVYMKMIPGFGEVSGYVLKTIFMASSDIPYFMPIFSTNNGEEFTGVNGFLDSSGALFPFNIFSDKMEAWNWSISGQTGSGKSVIINTIIAMEYGRYVLNKKKNEGAKPPVICIMDVGGEANSFGKIVKQFGGEIIQLHKVKKPYINLFELDHEIAMPTPKKKEDVMRVVSKYASSFDEKEAEMAIVTFYQNNIEKRFSEFDQEKKEDTVRSLFNVELNPEIEETLKLNPGECEPNADQLNLILSILEVMLSQESKSFNTFDGGQFKKSKVKQVVLDTYRSVSSRFPYLSDMVESVKGNPTEVGELFVELMNDWTRNGTYPMFDMDTDVDLKNDIILVDFKGIDQDPQLEIIYTLLFSRVFSKKMYSAKDQRRLLIRDEAWKVLQNNAAREYFISDLRTARKHKYATITSSQTLVEYLRPDPELGRVAIGQMQGHIIGKYQRANVGDLSSIIGVKPEIADVIPDLGTAWVMGKPEYSRFAVKVDNRYSILDNRLHPFEYWSYSSSADDNFILDHYSKKIGSKFVDIEDVIEFVSSGKHKGDEELIKKLIDSGKNEVAKKLIIR
jgi:hypothetical protein